MEMHTFDHFCCKPSTYQSTPCSRASWIHNLDVHYVDDGIHEELEVRYFYCTCKYRHKMTRNISFMESQIQPFMVEMFFFFVFQWCYVKLEKKIEDAITHNHQQLSTRIFNMVSSLHMCTNYIISHHTRNMKYTEKESSIHYHTATNCMRL